MVRWLPPAEMSFLQWVAHNTKKQVSEQLELKKKKNKDKDKEEKSGDLERPKSV